MVTDEYLFDCVKEGKVLDCDDYRVLGASRIDQLNSGKITGKKSARQFCDTDPICPRVRDMTIYY